jgi:hypothetical protein
MARGTPATEAPPGLSVAVSPPCVLPATPAELNPVTLAEPSEGVADAPRVTVALSLGPTGGTVSDGRSPVTDDAGVVSGASQWAR